MIYNSQRTSDVGKLVNSPADSGEWFPYVVCIYKIWDQDLEPPVPIYPIVVMYYGSGT